MKLRQLREEKRASSSSASQRRRKKKRFIKRDREEAHKRLVKDYFADLSTMSRIFTDVFVCGDTSFFA